MKLLDAFYVGLRTAEVISIRSYRIVSDMGNLR
jgi:hypothetical protein